MSVRHAMLGLLAQHSRHGYELHAAFEAVVGGEHVWDVKPAQIYTTLARLKDGGMVAEEGVEQAGGPEKRIYAVTPAGLAELSAWLATPVPSEHGRDQVYLKLMLSLVSGSCSPEQVIRAQRALLFQELHRATAERSRTDPRHSLAHVLLLDKTIMHLEADLRWLDMVETRLDDVQRQPLPEPASRPRGRPRKNPE